MKVKELIEELRKLDWELIVVKDWYEAGYDDIETPKMLEVVEDNRANWNKITRYDWRYSERSRRKFDETKKIIVVSL